MIGADLHHSDLVIEAVISTLFGGAKLELADLLITTTGNEVGDESHVLGGFHGVLTVATVLVAESLALAVGVPVIVGLIVAMILVERVIEVAVDP